MSHLAPEVSPAPGTGLLHVLGIHAHSSFLYSNTPLSVSFRLVSLHLYSIMSRSAAQRAARRLKRQSMPVFPFLKLPAELQLLVSLPSIKSESRSYANWVIDSL